jgi:soluble lytic murein transglycosylase-like protein
MASAPPPKGDYIARAAKRHRVPEELLRSVAHTESKHKTTAVSKRGARGEFQVMPATAKELGFTPEEMHDRDYGAEAGARILRKNRDRTGSWEDAVAAYNAGPARVAYRKKTGEPLPPETREYVRRVRRRRGELLGKDAEEALGGD